MENMSRYGVVAIIIFAYLKVGINSYEIQLALNLRLFLFQT
jgi:hypothetical protein